MYRNGLNLLQLLFNPIILKLLFLYKDKNWLNYFIQQNYFNIGWGRKKSGETAAGRRNFVLLEDAFLRSCRKNDAPIGMCFDRCGIYYDAHQSSDLEALVKKDLNAHQITEVHDFIEHWRSHFVSKYNDSVAPSVEIDEDYVVVIDQVFDDLSIRYGLAQKTSFSKMLAAALEENPNCKVVIKAHPGNSKKAGQTYFDYTELRKNPRIIIIEQNINLARLVKGATKVYCVTSQVGFEALIWGKKVRCFGMPFYAGYGLTEDDLQPPSRRKAISLEQLIYATFFEYCVFLNPYSGERISPSRAVSIVSARSRLTRLIPSKVYAAGFSAWKRRFLRQYLKGSSIRFVNSVSKCPEDTTCLVWGAANKELTIKGLRIIRIEDGFIRSRGLGADLIKPMSLIFDDVGIYFDSTSPSSLEMILNNQTFSNVDLHVADQLLKTIQQNGINKYNLGGQDYKPNTNKSPIILVPGQVETDASIKFGSIKITNNRQLLASVRKANPDAFIIYKPHPDVMAGLRKGGNPIDQMNKDCDAIVEDVDVPGLLRLIDEVHTMTSLMGFEALLFGKKVVCYGTPFYAGWGLTQDMEPCLRRTRQLRLNQLIAGALIHYPSYFAPDGKGITDANTIVTYLLNTKMHAVSTNGLLRIKRAILAYFNYR